MTVPAESRDLDATRRVVLIERHLNLEEALVAELEQMVSSLHDMLDQTGVRGLTQEQTTELQLHAGRISEAAARAQNSRRSIVTRINTANATGTLSLSALIRTLDSPHRERLDSVRAGVLERMEAAKAAMLGNQAVLFYSFEFHRKMLGALLHCDVQENQYQSDGQPAQVLPGNLYRKAC